MAIARSGVARRSAAVLAVTLASAIALTGCSGGSRTSTDARSTSVVYTYSGDLSSIDPINATFSETSSMDQALYDTLVAYSKDNKMIPELATDWTVSDDLMTIKLTLRSGVKFHDGTKLTAKDVAYSLDRVKKLGTGVAGRIKNYASSDVVDDTHVTIHLSAPDVDLLGALSYIYILDSALVEKHLGTDDAQSWLNKNEAGSGPYTLSGISGTTYSTKRFPGYWAYDAARPTSFAMTQINETSTLASEIKAGNVDIGKIAPSDTATLQSQVDAKKIVLKKAKDGAMNYIYFNTSTGPTANIAVRKAVSLAYDYENGATTIRQGLAALATGPLPTSAGCVVTTPEPKQDLDAARKTLSDAGLTGLHLTMGYQPNSAVNTQEATLLQSDLKEIGVTLDLTPVQFPQYLQLLAKFDTVPQMFLAADAPPFPSAGSLLNQNFDSTAIGSNRAAYSNPTFDAIMTKANATVDTSARCDLYKQAEQILVDDEVAMPLYDSEDLFAYRSDLGSTVYINPVGGTLYVKDLRITSGGK